jgi:hypothetical protein
VVYSQGIRRGAGEDRLFPDLSEAPSGRVFEPMLSYSFAVHGGCLLIRREAFDTAGYFDESLATAEDLDLSFRLAFHFQFLFEPGPVMIYNVSLDGLWLSSAANGIAASDHGRVVERAVRMLPDSPRYKKIREETPPRIAMSEMFPFILIGDFSEAWDRLLKALRTYPSSGRYPWVRSRVRWVARKLLLNAASPLSEARALCAQIEDVTRGGGITGLWYRRWILAEIWAEVFLSAGLSRRITLHKAVCAAGRAITYAPLNIPLMWRIGRVSLKRIKWRLRPPKGPKPV